MQGQRQGAGIGAKAGGQYHQCGPDQLRNRAQGIEQQPRNRLGDGAEAIRRGQRQQQAEQRRQQGADGRHGQGFQRAVADGAQVHRRQVGRHEAGGVIGHLPEPLRA